MTHLSVDRELTKAKSHFKKGQIEKARACCQNVLDVYPNNLRVINFLSSIGNSKDIQDKINVLANLYNNKQFDELIEKAKKLIDLNPKDYSLWNFLGAGYEALGQVFEASEAFKVATNKNPNFLDGFNNLALCLHKQGDLDGAIKAYKKVIIIKPDHFEAYNNLGVILQARGELVDAITAFQKALLIKPTLFSSLANLGNIFKELGRLDEAIEVYKKAILINPGNDLLIITKIFLQTVICDWETLEKDIKLIDRLGMSQISIAPWLALSLEDNPLNHRKRSEIYAKSIFQNKPILSSEIPKRIKTKPIKIGYFSADFHEYPGMYLMIGILETHNRNDFEIYAFSYGPDKNDEMRKRIINAVDHFVDIKNLSDLKVKSICQQENIDIAIHRNGYTKTHRSKLFSLRIAPIQINYLGYPGTLGTNYIDYIIADPTIIPQEYRDCYTEEIIYMPHCYQPNDNKRLISKKAMTKLDMGLPEDSFVFCSFNNNYKITKVEFNIWMRLLKEIEGSVLWLFKSNKWAEANLKKEAFNNGVDASRLIFAEKLPHDEHLARHKFADLFIDTFNYNAHTTASDALWAGLPVVTKIGKGFPARVAGSLLKAVGLPELITENEKEYEALILDLASNSDKLLKIKEKLRVNRLSQPLFDTELYTKNLEKAYLQVYKNYIDGKSPQTIYV